MYADYTISGHMKIINKLFKYGGSLFFLAWINFAEEGLDPLIL